MTEALAGIKFVEAGNSQNPEVFSDIVRQGLSLPQKSLPSRYFYDRFGSDQFEKICELPEYYLTRTEQAILQSKAREMVAAAGKNLTLVEFGCGSSAKTRILIEAALNRQDFLHYVPIDISKDFLRASSLQLQAEHPRLRITAIAAEYDDALAVLPVSESRFFLFLGSNIGNFRNEEATAFLSRIAKVMTTSDSLLVGIDLAKDDAIIEPAYNDSAGITERFNKNVLARINREIGGTFDLDLFTHEAPYFGDRVEMRLVSKKRHSVYIAGLHTEFHFAEGEYIHTEDSHKYRMDEFQSIACSAGLSLERAWMDDREWFAVTLLHGGGD